jgi:hypothetical protein
MVLTMQVIGLNSRRFQALDHVLKREVKPTVISRSRETGSNALN